MKQDQEITKVVFRKFKDGEVIALFPEIQYNEDRRYCMSYMHIGQHGSANYDLRLCCKLARPEEYASLLKELEDIGYNLKIQTRVNRKWFDIITA